MQLYQFLLVHRLVTHDPCACNELYCYSAYEILAWLCSVVVWGVCKAYTMIIGTAKTHLRLASNFPPCTHEVHPHYQRPSLFNMRFVSTWLANGVWNGREWGICTHEFGGNALLTTYIKATIWRLISFSSFESIPFHPWGATMESVPHMAEEVRALTLMLMDLPHGCTRGAPMTVPPYMYGQLGHGWTHVGATCARLGPPRVNTRGTSWFVC